MKDIQGINRGKCNECECEEYRAPPEPGRLRCEYCNHTPAEHVRIIALGACKCGDCDTYASDEPNKYTECQYCGCDASEHAGAEKLIKKKTKPVAPVVTAPQPQHPPQQHPSRQPIGSSPAGQVIQPKMSASGHVLQTAAQGSCSFPGCPFPKRIDESTGRTHDYCSRTCARKDAARAQASFSSQKPGPQQSAMQYTYQHAYPPRGGVPMNQGGGGGGSGGGGGGGGGGGATLCAKCNSRPANPGYSWCQHCHTNKI